MRIYSIALETTFNILLYPKKGKESGEEYTYMCVTGLSRWLNW